MIHILPSDTCLIASWSLYFESILFNVSLYEIFQPFSFQNSTFFFVIGRKKGREFMLWFRNTKFNNFCYSVIALLNQSLTISMGGELCAVCTMFSHCSWVSSSFLVLNKQNRLPLIPSEVQFDVIVYYMRGRGPMRSVFSEHAFGSFAPFS